MPEPLPPIRGPEIFLGDAPGDVERIDVPAPVGTPLALSDGRLMLWRPEGEPHRQRAVARYSVDSGRTWSGLETLFAFPPDRGTFSGGAGLVSAAGSIHLFGLDYYGFDFVHRERSRSHLWHACSRDGGRSWGPVGLVDFGLQYTGASSSAFQLAGGRIIAPVSGLSDRRTGAWVSLAPYSDDDGRTWHPPSQRITMNTGAADWYESGAAEPVGIELADGRVWLLPRSQDGFHWETFSDDGGITWSEARHSRFIANQSAMAVLRLEDGRLFLLWNNCGAEGLGEIGWGNAERAVLAAAVSDDEGRTWRGYREVGRVTRNAQVSYPYAAQAPDGGVLVSAADNLIRVDPRFLANVDVREDFSLGVARWSTLAVRRVTAVALNDPAAPSAREQPGRAMQITKPEDSIPAGACLNLPFGVRGEIALQVQVRPGFGGVHLTVTDHFDLPGLVRDGSFPLRILSSGRVEIVGSGGTWLATPGDLVLGSWHELRLAWDCSSHAGLVRLDGEEIARLEQYVWAPGICYLRIRLLSPCKDERGVLVRSVRATVAPA